MATATASKAASKARKTKTKKAKPRELTAEESRDKLAQIIGADPVAIDLMPDDVAKELLSAFEDAVPDAVAKSMRSIRMVDLGPDVYAQVQGFTNLQINKRYFGTAKGLARARAAQKLDFDSGWSSTSTSRGIFTHELGHVVDEFKLRDFTSPFRAAGDYVLDNPASALQLSEYGTTNLNEMFAEAFSAVFDTPKSQRNFWLAGFASELKKGYKLSGSTIPSFL